MRRRLVALAGLALAASVPAGAAESPIDGRVENLVPRVESIVERVESQGGSIDRLETPEAVRLTLSADVLFAFDSARLGPRSRRVLAEAAQAIEQGAGGVVRVDGHTDSKGSPAYNRQLSLRRAESVRAALARDAPGARFAVRGFGERKPVAPNTTGGRDDPEGRRRNRRVEIRFAKAGG